MFGMRSKGTAAELESRRLLAVRRVAEGWAQKDVAEFLGVHPVTVRKWVARHLEAGDDGLKAKPTPGRPRLLTPDQERKVLGWLGESPARHGFDTDLWTARRVAELIRKKFGVRFHPNYLREWLSRRNCTPQKPARRARQRDQTAIDRWVAGDWPRIQKRRGKNTPTSS
jgi:transposase